VLSAPIDAAHTSRAQILKLVEGPLADRAERIDVQFGSYVPNWTIITGHAQAKERDDCWVVTLHNVVDSGGTCMIAPAGGTMKEGPRRAVPNFCNIAYIIDDKTGQIVEGIPYA
jgi:hypothetical protein